MEKLLQDIRYGLRILVKHPGFTIVAVLALALGIGANTAIFSVVNGVLLSPLPFSNPDRLVIIWETNAQQGLDDWTVAPAKFIDWRDNSQSFEQVAAFWPYQASNLYFSGEPERIHSAAVSHELFQVLGTPALVGRTFLPQEDSPGNDQVVIISHALWRRRFNSNPGLVGSALRIDGKSYTVVGIMPEGFSFPERAEMWLPIAFSPAETKNREAHIVRVIGRMKPGLRLDQAQSEMAVLANQLEQQYPSTDSGWGVKVVPMLDQLVGKMRPALLILLGSVGLVLLIACANVANLLLARAASRQREIAIRTAVGATYKRLIRQMLTESIALGFIGGALGLLLSYFALRLLVAAIPEEVPRMQNIQINGWVLGFTLLVSLLTGVAFGLAPALRYSRPDLNETLKDGFKGSTRGVGNKGLRGLLVVAEIAISLVLMIAAGLMIKSLSHLQRVDPGFRSTNILTAQIRLASTKYAEDNQRAAFYQQVIKRVEQLPGVESAGAISTLPLGGDNLTFYLIIEGRMPQSQSEMLTTNFRIVSPNYFTTMNIPLKKGRFFNEHDTETSPRVSIVNETLANKYFPGQDPIGKRISIVIFDEPVEREIIGVVGDVRHSTLDAEPGSEVYDTYLQTPSPFMTLAVRTLTPPAGMGPSVRSAVRDVDTEQPIFNLKSMEQVVSDSLVLPRLSTVLFAVFAGVALFLAATGIYGVVSYSVAQRSHEIGIRMALGAESSDVLKLVLAQGVKLASVGVAIGLVVAFAATRLLSTLLYGISVTDPITFVAVSVFLISIALLATYIPARKAMRVDPLVVLRNQ